MTNESRIAAGIIFLTVPTIIYGGYFLLTLLSGQNKLPLTDFQRSMFRAGHAHAGVLVMLSLVALLYVDIVPISETWQRFIRISLPLSAILVSGGFFASAAGPGRTQPNKAIVILYAGVVVLISGLLAIGILLLKN